jgi:hypothetical protein
MEIESELRRAIYHREPTHVIRAMHRENGGMTLREEGVRIALAGRTSLEEILRVTSIDEVEGDEMPGGEKRADASTPRTPKAGAKAA